MIRQLRLNEIDKLKPLLEQFYLEQQTYNVSFDWDHIKSQLQKLIINPLYLILVHDDFNCFLIGHISSNILLPIYEAYEDYIYVHPTKRGSSRFIKLLKMFEAWCETHQMQYINIGIGTGITNEKTKELYLRCGYTEYLTGFKKEVQACVVEAVDAAASLVV